MNLLHSSWEAFSNFDFRDYIDQFEANLRIYIAGIEILAL